MTATANNNSTMNESPHKKREKERGGGGGYASNKNPLTDLGDALKALVHPFRARVVLTVAASA